MNNEQLWDILDAIIENAETERELIKLGYKDAMTLSPSDRPFETFSTNEA